MAGAFQFGTPSVGIDRLLDPRATRRQIVVVQPAGGLVNAENYCRWLRSGEQVSGVLLGEIRP